LVNPDTAGNNAFWPPGDQAYQFGHGPIPVLLEPGTRIVIGPSGAGVSASTFNYEINLHRTKLLRAQDPTSS
jgi:hypothetical protein